MQDAQITERLVNLQMDQLAERLSKRWLTFLMTSWLTCSVSGWERDAVPGPPG
jgi:hypothetical protein